MDNIKKLGLTALAGSMVATAAHSAELSASGSWALSYTSEDDDTVNGQAFTMGDSVTFTGSGELDNGFTASVKYELDGGNFDDEQLKLDMGDMGEFAYGESNSGYGIDIASNMVPAVDTAIYSAVGTDTVSHGVARSAQDTGNLGWTKTVDDLKAVAKNNGIESYHVEAGLRSKNIHAPEERNRIMVDAICDKLFTPSKDAVQNL